MAARRPTAAPSDKPTMSALGTMRPPSFEGHGIGKDLLIAVAEASVGKDHTSMLVWLLEQSPAVRFYEKPGAEPLMSTQIEIGGISLTELALG